MHCHRTKEVPQAQLLGNGLLTYHMAFEKVLEGGKGNNNIT
jgi:hypothetical protein